jgi:hypothetical protein
MQRYNVIINSTITYKNKIIIYILLFIACGIIENSCIIKSKINIFSDIPQSTRERFIKRFNMLIEYERMQNWKCIYNMLYSRAKREENIEEFIERHTRHNQEESKLVNFIIESINKTNDPGMGSTWSILGCKIQSSNGYIDKYYGILYGFYEEGDWYFHDTPDVIPSQFECK